MGPQASQTFYQWILDRTDAVTDQEHVPAVIISDIGLDVFFIIKPALLVHLPVDCWVLHPGDVEPPNLDPQYGFWRQCLHVPIDDADMVLYL